MVAVRVPRGAEASLQITPVPNTGSQLCVAEVTATQITQIEEDNGSRITPTHSVMPDNTGEIIGACLVNLNAQTGRVQAVIPIADRAFSTGVAGAESGVKAQAVAGRAVLTGRFLVMLTPSGSAAPSGAVKLVLDSRTGELLAIE